MKLSGYGSIGISVALAVMVFIGFPAEAEAVASISKIEESVLDAKIGDRKNRLVMMQPGNGLQLHWNTHFKR